MIPFTGTIFFDRLRFALGFVLANHATGFAPTFRAANHLSLAAIIAGFEFKSHYAFPSDTGRMNAVPDMRTPP